LGVIFDKLHGLQSVDMPEDVLALVEQATDTVQTAMYRATDYDHGWNQTQNVRPDAPGEKGLK